MKRKSAIVIMGILLMMAQAGLCSAGETFTVRVSATIPAIPGVNAPLLEHESSRQARPVQALEPVAQAAVTQQTQEQKEENLQSTEERPTVIVKTFYSK